MLGGSSSLPGTLRHHYTEGMRAVLTVIAGEVKRQGRCCLPIDQVAALAGVCRTTVQSTLHEARRLGHVSIIERPRPGQKSLTNVVEIVSPEWHAWLKRGPRRIGSNPPIRPEISSTTRMEERLLGGMASRIGGAPPLRSSAWQYGRSAPMEGRGSFRGAGPVAVNSHPGLPPVPETKIHG
jgi:hypothetical protein